LDSQYTETCNTLNNFCFHKFLKEKETLSEYSIEYTTALFMNLSLRSAGKTKCEDPKVIINK